MKVLTKNLLAPKQTLFFALSYTAIILLLSLMRLDNMPTPKFDNSDKYMHAIAYFGLTIIWYVYYFSSKSWKLVQIKSLTVICLLIIAFGIFIEVLQDKLTTYRTIDSLDVLANSIGVTVAFFVILMMKKQLKKVKNKL
ncbi:hypothetical protein SAMN04488096_105276 [Mesonia phycicola]|uniref:VanZ like family protein n=1 Tax=Mesonia phycicola TaxID=579105 RepID=A0A1M6EV15_9FLAO|nr:VanZ family protein [Mesonia phycicola]SHI89305.1 hypothetical protein SAMN04488096_105276 [Mesonia phycicola]